MPYEAKNEASKVSEAKGNKTMSYEAKGETQGNKAKPYEAQGEAQASNERTFFFV
jgi:hypothetical protein